MASTADIDPLARFDALPRRLFLDSSTLQTMLDYGGSVFEGEEPPSGSRAFSIPGFLDDLEALAVAKRECALSISAPTSELAT
jgi:hypothetical protein